MTQESFFDDGDATDMQRSASFSPCRRYRYRLSRRWRKAGKGDQFVTWIMLNPSTADETKEDPTIRRCIGFSRAWNFSALEIVNLFAFRSTDPRGLVHALANGIDPIGPENNAAIVEACRGAGLVMAAWGAHSLAMRRAHDLLHLSGFEDVGHNMMALGFTLTGQPKHPLYVRSDTKPMRLWPE